MTWAAGAHQWFLWPFLVLYLPAAQCVCSRRYSWSQRETEIAEGGGQAVTTGMPEEVDAIPLARTGSPNTAEHPGDIPHVSRQPISTHCYFSPRWPVQCFHWATAEREREQAKEERECLEKESCDQSKANKVSWQRSNRVGRAGRGRERGRVENERVIEGRTVRKSCEVGGKEKRSKGKRGKKEKSEFCIQHI